MPSDQCLQYKEDYEKLLELKQGFDEALGEGERTRDFSESMRLKAELEKGLTEIAEELKNVEIEEEIKRGDFSRMGTLTRLHPETAAVLAMYEGILGLNSLTTMTLETAVALAKHKGNWLVLNGLTTITPEVALALAEHESGLGLNGLTAITQEISLALAKHKGDLGLEGLTTITSEIAAVLAEHKDGLWLDGLTAITPEVAAALAKHEGDLWLKDRIKKQVNLFR